MNTQFLAGLVAAALLAGCNSNSSGGSNHAPVALAGAPATTFKHAMVTLDGSASSDVDGDNLSYRWTQTSGATVNLSDATSATPSFAAPGASGALTFQLVVSDGRQESAADAVTITVQNRAPISNSGDNVAVSTGALVLLDGRGSTDIDGDALTYDWSQHSGLAVVLDEHADGTATFTSPSEDAILEFLLTVSDGEASATSDVTVVVQASGSANRPPVADAGTDATVPKRSAVQLNGSGQDPDFDPLTYSWRQVAGPEVALDDGRLQNPSFVAPTSPAELQFELTTSDGRLTSAPDVVTIHVQNFEPTLRSVSLSPAAPRTLDDITVAVEAMDPDGDPVTLSYQWIRNGDVIAGQQAATLPNTEQAKNDTIKVVVSASDGDASTSGEASVLIQDTPPTLAAAAPSAVDYGDTVAFQVTVSDPDEEDPEPTLAIDHGPAGMSIDDDGLVTWKANTPLFEQSLNVNWQVGTASGAIARIGGAITIIDADRPQALRRTGIEIPYGPSGLVVSDLDGDGDSEALVGSRRGLYELAKSGADFAQVWTIPFGDGSQSVSAVDVADLDGDGRQEIFLSAGGRVTRLDGKTRRVAAVYTPEQAFYCRDIEVADLTADGDLELVCIGSHSDYQFEGLGWIVVFDTRTLEIEWQSPELTVGRTLAVGNVDNDTALEIVTSAGLVYDGRSLANQWVYDVGFGFVVDTGDLDGDGIEEIVGMGDWNFIRGYSAVLRSPLWEQPGFDFDAMIVVNFDDDPMDEILVGEGQWGSIIGFDYVNATNSLSQAWQVPNPDHGVTSIASGDIDGDGRQEIIWGAGASSSGADVLAIAGFNPDIGIEWQNEDPQQLDGNFTGARLATVAPGRQRVLFEAPQTDSGYSGMRLIALDPSAGTLETSGEQGSNWARAAAMDVADYDNDGVDEVLVASANFYNAYYAAIDFTADAVEWTSSIDEQDIGVAVTHADMNGDGAPDFVGITSRGFVEVRDMLHQTLIWKSTSANGGGRDVVVADLDRDGVAEIIALSGSRVVVYRKNDSVAAYVEAHGQSIADALDLLAADTDGNGDVEIYVLSGSSFGSSKISRFDASLNVLGSAEFEWQVNSLFVEEVPGGRTNLVVSADVNPSGADEVALLMAIDPETGAEVWRSPRLDDLVRINSLSYFDLNGDGNRRIAFGTGAGMYATN